MERLKQLRLKTAEVADTSITSSSKEVTTLAAFLGIYNKAGYEVCINYMVGAKALHTYLSPITIPDIPEQELPKNCPALFNKHEVRELAYVFYPITLVQRKTMSAEEWHTKVDYIERVIIYLTCKEVTANGNN